MTDVAALETFVAVARLGSVVRAAERLGRTQPSLSARLAALEAAWRTKLFRRHARGMSLTPEGARLLALAETTLRSLEALDRAAGLPVADARELRVGAGDALGRERLPRALSALLRDDRDLSVRLVEGSSPRLMDALRGGEIDLALVAGAAAGGPAPRGIELVPLFQSRVELLVPATDRSRAGATLSAVGSARLVTLQRGSGFRRHLEEAFAAAGVPFRPTVEVGNLSLVRRFVASGLGVAPVPSVAFSPGSGRRGVAVRPLRGVSPVPYAAAFRQGVPLPPRAEKLLALLARG